MNAAGADSRTAQALGLRLAASYRAVALRLADVPIVNPRLEVEAIGFRPHQGWAVGVMVTPWFMNIAVAALEEGPPLPPGQPGGGWSLRLPAGGIGLTIGQLDGFGRVDSASLFSPMEAFPDPATARITAMSAIAALFTPAAGPV